MQSLNPHIEAELEKYESGRANANQTILALRNCGLSPAAANETLRRFNLDRAKPAKPTTEIAAEDLWRRVPLGYIHEITTHRCVTCDSASHTSRLIAIRRAGSNSQVKTIVPLGEPIYSGIECVDVALEAQTRICQHCITTAPRTAQPPRPVNTHFRRGVTEGEKIDLRSAQKKPAFTETDLFNL